jgi:hypothetical protein
MIQAQLVAPRQFAFVELAQPRPEPGGIHASELMTHVLPLLHVGDGADNTLVPDCCHLNDLAVDRWHGFCAWTRPACSSIGRW